jgi:uncharacterized protein (UPF0332 family)
MKRNLSIDELMLKSSEGLIGSDVAQASNRFNDSINGSYDAMFHVAAATDWH